MYRVPNDKRSKKTANLLLIALSECLKQKTLDDITVTDISKISTVSRSTIYRLFDTPLDILDYAFHSFLEQTTNYVANQREANSHDFFIGLTNINMEHNVLISIVVRNHLQSYFFFMKQHMHELLDKHFSYHFHACTSNQKYFSSIYSSMVLGLLTTWISRGCLESSEELYSILHDCLESSKDFIYGNPIRE